MSLKMSRRKLDTVLKGEAKESQSKKEKKVKSVLSIILAKKSKRQEKRRLKKQRKEKKKLLKQKKNESSEYSESLTMQFEGETAARRDLFNKMAKQSNSNSNTAESLDSSKILAHCRAVRSNSFMSDMSEMSETNEMNEMSDYNYNYKYNVKIKNCDEKKQWKREICELRVIIPPKVPAPPPPAPEVAAPVTTNSVCHESEEFMKLYDPILPLDPIETSPVQSALCTEHTVNTVTAMTAITTAARSGVTALTGAPGLNTITPALLESFANIELDLQKNGLQGELSPIGKKVIQRGRIKMTTYESGDESDLSLIATDADSDSSYYGTETSQINESNFSVTQETKYCTPYAFGAACDKNELQT